MSTTETNEPKIKSLLDVDQNKGTAPMTEEQTAIFVSLFLREKVQRDSGVLTAFDFSNPKSDSVAASEFFESFQFKVFAKRIVVCAPQLKLSYDAALFILAISASPGDLVMWAYTLHRLGQRLGTSETIVGLQELADRFPFGFPTEEARHEIWKAQKRTTQVPGRTDNLIDDERSWL